MRRLIASLLLLTCLPLLAQTKDTDQPNRWKKFLNYYQGQLKELSDTYTPDLYWFDGDWEHNSAEWQVPKVRKMLLIKNSNTIINSRLRGQGDYATPEQDMPITRPENKYWELCMTMNNSWGYQKNDHDYKTTSQFIGILADVIGNGGNLLLDIGPKADESIPKEHFMAPARCLKTIQCFIYLLKVTRKERWLYVG